LNAKVVADEEKMNANLRRKIVYYMDNATIHCNKVNVDTIKRMDCHDYLSTTQDNYFNNLSSLNNSIFNCEKTYSDGLMSIKKHNKIIKQKDAIIQSQKEAIERFSIAN
jgi:hypothetical protein